MAEDDWREEPIDRRHDRNAFDCGIPELNEYLRRFARQNHTGGGAKTFVAVPREDPARILAYYSISASALDIRLLPEAVAKGRGRYELPVFRLGRLAVSKSVQGRSIGSRMLFAAARRAAMAAVHVGGMALVIDAKNETVADWYRRFGAISLLDSRLSLILPFDVIARSIRIVDDEKSES